MQRAWQVLRGHTMPLTAVVPFTLMVSIHFVVVAIPVVAYYALLYLAASGLLLRYARLRNNSHPAMQLLPISALLLAVEQGRVEEAVMSIGACSYRLNSGELCQSTLLPNDAKLLTTLLHRHAVQYRSAGPPGWRAAMVLLVPFAYLGACGWLLHRMTSDNGPFGSGGGPDGSEPMPS